MGNCCVVEGAVDHWIYVKTGDRRGAGSDANIKLILRDDKENASPEIALDCNFKNDFERGSTDIFQAPPLPGFGRIVEIEFWRDNSGIKPDWFCEVIVINDRRSGKCFYFPVQRWVVADRRYKIKPYDTALPQMDENLELRKTELVEKKQQYRYDQKAPDLPVQALFLPDDEHFSDDYKWDIVAKKMDLLAKSHWARVGMARWMGLEDIVNIFTTTMFPEPMGTHRWSNDICFGAQRLVGCNPVNVKLCTQLPENLGVTAEMLKPFLEGWALQQIIQAKRLFIVDHRILENLPTKNDRPVCAPIGLFFVTGDKQLLPIAIQLHQDIAPNNPVFLPNDPPFTWLLAKMWFNHADASYHQSVTHLGYTHILMEGICLATHRCLSVTHPVFKLLAPHFIFLLAINDRGLTKLVAPDGWVDKTMSIGREGMFELIRRASEEYRLDLHGSLPRQLEARGVLDPRILPNYAYRDDALLLHQAIEIYVGKVVKHYYDIPQKVSQDYELQEWAKELVVPKERGGCGIKGVPGNGRFSHTGHIIAVCTSIIFTCSVQHAAVNFSQYDEYGFPPNYPAFLYGNPPTDKTPRSEMDIVEALPTQEQTLDCLVVTKLLSMNETKNLGDWEFQYQYDPPALKAENEFKEKLKEISKTIKERNVEREEVYKYPYLDPDIIPNAISI